MSNFSSALEKAKAIAAKLTQQGQSGSGFVTGGGHQGNEMFQNQSRKVENSGFVGE